MNPETPTVFHLWHLDDNDDDALLLRHVVHSLHPECLVVSHRNGVTARRALEQTISQELPELILTDLRMPNMNGLEFLKWLRNSEFGAIPLVVFTASLRPGDVEAAYAAGAKEVIEKPCTLNEWKKVLGDVLDLFATAHAGSPRERIWG